MTRVSVDGASKAAARNCISAAGRNSSENIEQAEHHFSEKVVLGEGVQVTALNGCNVFVFC